MRLEDARRIIIEADAEVKKVWPDAWAMFLCTVAGHLQFSINRPKRWGLFTFDIKADAPDWLEQFEKGAQEMRDAILALNLAKSMSQK